MPEPCDTLAGSLSLALPASAETITVTDMAGRTVEVPHGAERIILGEGRMMYAVVPLILFDPDAFRKFEARFPDDTARLINFGNYSGDFSVETALANGADLA